MNIWLIGIGSKLCLRSKIKNKMACSTTWEINLYCEQRCKNSVQPDLQTLERIAQLLNIDKKDLLTPSQKDYVQILNKAHELEQL